jgi:hypothetical protein
MAVRTDVVHGTIYEVAGEWVQRCLAADGALFGNGSVWRVDTLEALDEAVFRTPGRSASMLSASSPSPQSRTSRRACTDLQPPSGRARCSVGQRSARRPDTCGRASDRRQTHG